MLGQRQSAEQSFAPASGDSSVPAAFPLPPGRPPSAIPTGESPVAFGSRPGPGPSEGEALRFPPGTLIAGRFLVVRFIAKGGMGEVYEVEDQFLQGVHVALKIILPEIAADADMSHRFEQEVLLARKVAHQNLCPIYDIFRCQDPPPPFLFLTMKLLTGETLATKLRRTGRVTGSEAVSIFRQMVAGLAAIHAQGIVHRDIKPTNVMLDGTGSEICVSIMDFGLARLHQAQTITLVAGQLSGTVGYMAPEVLRGYPASQATDLFALGVLLHEVLTGKRPAAQPHGASVTATAELDQADVPVPFREGVKDFLSDDPERRCKAFKDIKLRSESGSLPAVTAAPHFLTRRHVLTGGAVAACALASGLAWKREAIENYMHPLPQKRFVALLGWPPTPDASLQPMISGVVDGIASSLSRAEAFDRNFVILAQRTLNKLITPAEVNEARESLGANLILGVSNRVQGKRPHLLLSVFDASMSNPLRHKQIQADDQLTLPQRATEAAANLLDVAQWKAAQQQPGRGTDSNEAYTAFQEGEALRKEDNDKSLDEAIDKFKRALEIDPRFAMAQSSLAWAFLRSYGLRGDPAMLASAKANCESALALNPDLVDAHLGLGTVYLQTGDREGASKEIARALALDPTNPHTLTYQATFYASINRYKDAEATFERALKLRPNYWLGHNEFGVIYDNQAKYSQALMQFRLANVAAPKNALALANIGSVYLQLGKVPEAVDYLNASMRLKPIDGAAQNLSAALLVQGKFAEAVALAHQAVDLNGSEAGNWLQLADCLAAAPKTKSQALEAYKRAAAVEEEHLRTEKKDGPGWMLLALCRAKIGADVSTGQATIAFAESLAADDIDSQLRKIRTLELLGKRTEALAAAKRCLDRGATAFQLDTMPDLGSLRSDHRYGDIISAVPKENSSALS
jgi:serine/threonine protein kinase/Tfp pilus assembly protein PilF